jgi:3-hydroxyacyl-CoA dehydrogenase/enoyl-CoA hydratase/3-hydroxybutyryl-CoA epimerase
MDNKNWRLVFEPRDKNPDGLAWLYFDKAGEAANTFSSDVMEELRAILGALTAAQGDSRPKGLVILSGKDSGFIAGADVHEFTKITSPEEALKLVRRGWDTFNELAAAPFPTLALIKGFCMGGGVELALACTYRIAVDEPGTRFSLPEVMLGIVPGWGGMRRLPRAIGAPAPRHDADRAHDRCEAREEAGAGRRGRPGARDDQAARITLRDKAAGASRRSDAAADDVGPVKNFIASRARKQTEKKARQVHYPAPYAISTSGRKRTRSVRVSGRASVVAAGIARASDDAQPDSRFRIAGTAEGTGQGVDVQGRARACRRCRHDGRRHRRRGARCGDCASTLQDQTAEKLAPAMGRAAKLFKDRLKDPRRIRDASDRLIPMSRVTARVMRT